MGQYKDRTGERFGRVVVLERAENSKHGKSRQRCKCDCGKIFVTDTQNLVNDDCQSCGCLRKELLGSAHRTHGLSKEAIYAVWCDMRHRCLNPQHHEYKNYGGRGISVCEEWHKFEVFYAWAISSGYAKGLSIERKDVNGNYCPENCTWITMKEQARNRRNNVVYDGKTQNEWARELGLSRTTLFRYRKKHNCDLKSAVEFYQTSGSTDKRLVR